ncbi:MAG: sensor histidine kinase [Campylobacterota bacterium]
MKLLHSERKIVTIIKYGVIFVIILFSSIISYTLINQKKEELKKEAIAIEKNYINHNKKMVESLVNKVYNFIEIEKKIEFNELKNDIKQEVYQAHSIATAIYKRNIKKPNYSKAQTIKEIKNTLRTIRFNNDLGYIFMYELNGKNILNSQFPSIEGKNLWNHEDKRGVSILQDMNRLLSKKDEAFYEWYWRKDKNSEKEYKKIGFFKKFEPFDLFIGTGDYIEEYERILKDKILKKINSLNLQAPEHLFIYTLDGLCLANPKEELIGQNRYNSQNKNGVYVLKDLINYTKNNKEGFVRYQGSVILNKNNKTNDKISYVRLVDDLNWMIGSGFYLEKLYTTLEKRKDALKVSTNKTIEKIIYISILLTLIMIIVSFYISKIVASIFDKYKQKVRAEIKNVYEKEKLLIQQSKMATMGEMIGNIAHQWKQPLNLISVSNSLIKLNQENDNFSTKEQLNEAIKNIDNSIKHLSTTIDDFRNFFKPDKEKKEYYLKEAFEKTNKLISSQFKNNDILLIENIENIKLYGYPNELLQVLINIIKNAKDELIKLEKEQKRLLFIDTYTQDEFAIIKVTDSAGGIDEKIKDRIFEAYFTTKKEDEGTGVGLHMSKQIIEGMKGSIEAQNSTYEFESIKYKGASFIIKLPLN